MIRYEKLLLDNISDICLVVGDVTSTMACSIVAKKFGHKYQKFRQKKKLEKKT